MRQGLKVSLIIPVYNESGKIRACMDNIAGVDGLHEVIFADGGSTDGTPDIIGGRYRVLRCGKGRARQMNAAAKEAAGDILWFSHCDGLLPKDGAEEIIAAVNARRAVHGLQHAELKPAGAAVAYRLRGSGNIYG